MFDLRRHVPGGMVMTAEKRSPGLSSVDEAAIAALAACHVETQKAVQELARVIAARNGIELSRQPEPHKPQRRGRHRFASITRHAPGDVTADVVNTETGQTRQFRFTKNG